MFETNKVGRTKLNNRDLATLVGSAPQLLFLDISNTWVSDIYPLDNLNRTLRSLAIRKLNIYNAINWFLMTLLKLKQLHFLDILYLESRCFNAEQFESYYYKAFAAGDKAMSESEPLPNIIVRNMNDDEEIATRWLSLFQSLIASSRAANLSEEFFTRMPHNNESITFNPEHLLNLLKLIMKYIFCNEDQGAIDTIENRPLLNYLPGAGSPLHNNYVPYQSEYIAASWKLSQYL
ncbi:hypothetical protein ACTXT7_010136 [Hymenolepis weldensis]